METWTNNVGICPAGAAELAFAIPKKLICGGTGGVDAEVPDEDCTPLELFPVEPVEELAPETPVDEVPAPPEAATLFTVIAGAVADAIWFPLPSTI